MLRIENEELATEIRSLPPIVRLGRILGGMAELGRRLGADRRTVANWQKTGIPDPDKRRRAAELGKGVVTEAELTRPDA